MTRLFKPRPFVAFVVTFAFLITTITGIVLYIVPQGRIANWVDWHLLWLGKDQWADLHILLGLVFILAAVALATALVAGAIARLEQAGVTASPGETLRKAGEPSGHTPVQLMQIMLLGAQSQEH